MTTYTRRFFLCALAALLPSVAGMPAAAAQNSEFKTVSLDTFIEREKEMMEGKTGRVIKMAEPIAFTAKMKRYPEERRMTYVYTALELSGVSPMPEVGHRMFVESEHGRIIPVYVEKQAAAKIQSKLKEEAQARFLAYHLYSYSKGPAILVVDLAAAQ